MRRSLLAALAVATSATAFYLPKAPASAGRLLRHASEPRMDFFTDLKMGAAKLMAGQYDAEAVRSEIENNIARKPCVMYSTSTCPFCQKAREVLDGLGTMYTVVDLDEEENGMAIKAELAGIIGRTSVPAVFVGGEFVGGCNDGGLGGVMTLQRDGKLEPLLIQSGAVSASKRI